MTTLTPIPLTDLKPHPANPKAHDADLLDASLDRFGYIEPVVRDDRTGLILSGHGRVEALSRKLARGEQPPPQVSVSEDGSWLVPTIVGWSSADDNEAYAAMIALNRTTERGGWDTTNLVMLLDSLLEADDTLDAVGYTETDVAVLRKLVEADGVMTSDLQDAIDEFIDMTGGGDEKIDFKYDTVLRVYFQTPEARTAFYEAIGYEPDAKAKTLRYPATFVRETLPTYLADVDA